MNVNCKCSLVVKKCLYTQALWSNLARGRERHFRTGERADSLNTALFRSPVLALAFSATTSGRHFAGFPVVISIKTLGICVNCARDNAAWSDFKTQFQDGL